MKEPIDWLYIYDWILDCLTFATLIALATLGLLF